MGELKAKGGFAGASDSLRLALWDNVLQNRWVVRALVLSAVIFGATAFFQDLWLLAGCAFAVTAGVAIVDAWQLSGMIVMALLIGGSLLAAAFDRPRARSWLVCVVAASVAYYAILQVLM